MRRCDHLIFGHLYRVSCLPTCPVNVSNDIIEWQIWVIVLSLAWTNDQLLLTLAINLWTLQELIISFRRFNEEIKRNRLGSCRNKYIHSKFQCMRFSSKRADCLFIYASILYLALENDRSVYSLLIDRNVLFSSNEAASSPYQMHFDPLSKHGRMTKNCRLSWSTDAHQQLHLLRFECYFRFCRQYGFILSAVRWNFR